MNDRVAVIPVPITDFLLPVPLDGAALSTELAAMRRGALEYQLKSLAPSTLASYANNWNEFKWYCARYRREPLPASVETVTMYLKWCADARDMDDVFLTWQQAMRESKLKARGKTVINKLAKPRPLKISALQQRLATIATIHSFNDIPSPTEMSAVQRTMDGILTAYLTSRGSISKRAILDDELRTVLARIGSDTLIDVRDAALYLLSFLGALRRSELVAMQMSQLAFDSEGLVYSLPVSKTNRLGKKGAHRKALAWNADPALCPVRRVESWLAASSITSGAVFRNLVHGQVGTALTGRGVWEIVRGRQLDVLCDWLQLNAATHSLVTPLKTKNGTWVRSRFTAVTIEALVKEFALSGAYDPRSSSPHGFRSGFVSTARRKRKADYKIKETTGHTTDAMLDRYTHSMDLWEQNATRDLL